MAAKDFWFPFEPKVWLSDSALRGCTKQARAVWMDMICLMHDREVQGVLKDGNQAWTLERIASSIPGDTTENLTNIRELLTNGVASREEGTGAIVCRMMHRRWLKRNQCSAAGKSGGGSPVFKRNRKHPPKHNDKHPSYFDSDSSSSGVTESEEVQEKPKPKGGNPRAPCAMPAALDTDQFRGVWADWLAYRKERNLKTTAATEKRQLKFLETLGHDGAALSIDESIRNGWQGLFHPKTTSGKFSSNNQPGRTTAKERSINRGDYPEPQSPLPRL